MPTYISSHKSVDAWAKSLGSKAKTHAGQRKAILASQTKHLGLILTGHMGTRNQTVAADGGYLRLSSHVDRSTYTAQRNRNRQERFAATHPTTLAWPAPATRNDVQGDCSRQYDLLTLQNERPYKGFARYGDWVIRVEEDVDYDYSFYAKSYGHPKKTVNSRTVLIRRVKADGTLDKQDITVDSFRGNYLLNALVQTGVCPATKGLMSVRLHTVYGVNVVRSGRILKIYERTLNMVRVDYCAVAGDYTFHAGTIREAIAGLRKKAAAAQLRSKGQAIDLTLCKSLGFCDAGIRQFADAYDLSLKGIYSPDQIADAIRRNPGPAAPFTGELRTLANAVGYAIPADLAA